MLECDPRHVPKGWPQRTHHGTASVSFIHPGNTMAITAPPIGIDAPRSVTAGMVYAVSAISVFALQDAMTKFLVSAYPISQFLLVRFAVFAVFALGWAAMQGGLQRALKTQHLWLQLARAALLIGEIYLFCMALQFLSLGDLHAIYATTPLVVTILAGLLLGEAIGWRRRVAVALGFLGALIIIRPGLGVMHWAALLVLASGFGFALYIVATRKVGRDDSVATSTLYVAAGGAALVAPFGITQWQPMDLHGALLMGGISLTGVVGHMLYITALTQAPAVVIQPFTYLLLVWAVIYGFVFFGTLPDTLTVLGALIVVISGLYVSWREWVRSREPKILS